MHIHNLHVTLKRNNRNGTVRLLYNVRYIFLILYWKDIPFKSKYFP